MMIYKFSIGNKQKCFFQNHHQSRHNCNDTIESRRKAESNLSASEPELLYDRTFTGNQFVLASNPLTLTTINFSFSTKPFGHSPYVTSSVTRWWVCRLQLLLVLASAVILGTLVPWISWPQFTVSVLRLPLTSRVRSPYFYPPGTGCPSSLGSLFVASYDSQGYGEGIRTRLHTGLSV
jgi:hypothetical protein